MVARRRPKINPEVVNRPPTRVRTAYDEAMFGAPSTTGRGRRTIRTTRPPQAIDYASGRTAKAEADQTISYETALAIQRAKDGDDSDLLPYQPTPSINPPRPRTQAAGYDPRTQTLRVKFRNGEGYEYYGVPPRVWRNFKRVQSPGRFINRTLNFYPYAKASWGE